MKIKIKKMREDAKLPSYAHPGDVGMDLFAVESVVIPAGERALIWNGFALEFPTGFAAIVKDKSGTARSGLHVLGGVYDAGYRGEYNTQLVNLSDSTITIERGQKVSQLVLFPVEIPELEEVLELSESSRGEGRFGSTGKV